jgi:hypothetical protein
MRYRILLGALSTASLVLLSACGGDPSHPSSGTTTSSGVHTSGNVDPGMGNMVMPSGNGLSATLHGYTLTTASTAMPDMAMAITFTITHNGQPVTAFDEEQTKLMHFYLIRADLTGFQHVHPSLGSGGVWSVTPAALGSGPYRMYVQFVPHADAQAGPLILSRALTVSGNAASNSPLPSPTTTSTVDGYIVELSGTPLTGKETPLTLTRMRMSRRSTKATSPSRTFTPEEPLTATMGVRS